MLFGLSRALWFTKLSYILRDGPPAGKRESKLLLTSVYGAQDPVATASLGHQAMSHQLGATRDTLCLGSWCPGCCIAAFLGHSLS